MRRHSTVQLSLRFRPARMAAHFASARQGLAKPARSAGDLLVSLKIVLPDEADSELVALMRKWESQKPYNPRSGMK